jgi:hypothetical protein
MNKTSNYSNLNFKRQPRRMPPKIIASLVIMTIFTFLWVVIPQIFLYWILVIPLVCLAWAATYGFRNALSDLIKMLQKLEHI